MSRLAVTALALAALGAGCQMPGLLAPEPAPAALSVRASVLPEEVVVTWDQPERRGADLALVPVRVHAGGVLEEGEPRPVSGGRATAARAELGLGTWRFRLSATDADGAVIADELSPPVTIEPEHPGLDVLERADLGLAEGFHVSTLLTFPAWAALCAEGHDADLLVHARRELERVMRAAVECSLGETYPASLADLQRVEKARDVLAPRGGDPAVLTHALRAKSLLVFDLRLPAADGSVPAQLVARVYDLTYRRYDQELLKLLNGRPLVYEDYVELDYEPGVGADNSGALLEAYGRLARQMLADGFFRTYFELLEREGDKLFVDEASQDVLLRALGRKLADVQRDGGRAANHRRVERDLLFTRRPTIVEPPPAEPEPADPQPFGPEHEVGEPPLATAPFAPFGPDAAEPGGARGQGAPTDPVPAGGASPAEPPHDGAARGIEWLEGTPAAPASPGPAEATPAAPGAANTAPAPPPLFPPPAEPRELDPAAPPAAVPQRPAPASGDAPRS